MGAKIVKVNGTQELPTEILQELRQALHSCKILAVPTDTVYGLICTGMVKAAQRRIYQIKGRSSLKPLPIFVKSKQEAQRWAQWTPAAERLANRFWPGPLTLALKPSKEGNLLKFQEYPTLAIRAPGHPLLMKILESADIPLASTSANHSGEPALTACEDVIRIFQDQVDYILDGGAAPGRESTLVDATQEPVRILREGRLSREEILRVATLSAL